MTAAGQSLERGRGAAEMVFSTFPPAEALRALTYFEDGDLARLERQERELLTRAVSLAGTPMVTPIIQGHSEGHPRRAERTSVSWPNARTMMQ